MFEFAPDYSGYSTTELLNALSLVDRERFAGRLADIRSELARRGVRYDETREVVDGKPRYKVRLLKTVPSETLSKQWQNPSHDVEMGDEDNDFDIISMLTSCLVVCAYFWWFRSLGADFQPSMVATSLMLLFIGFFLLTLGPKAFQGKDAVVAEHSKRMLFFYVALGLSAVPFFTEQIHKLIADVSKPTVTVLEIYNGSDNCEARILLETSESELLQVCQVPSHILDRVRPNDRIQIARFSSILGVNADSQRIVIIPAK